MNIQELATGDAAEKIVTAFQLLDGNGNVNEETSVNMCAEVICRLKKMEKDIVNISSQGEVSHINKFLIYLNLHLGLRCYSF